MGKIIISENITLDGVGEDPTGEEGFDRGGWFTQITDGDRSAWAKIETAEALAGAALLLGRRSYDYFATRWASRTGDWAEKLNSMPKYVVSSSLKDPQWNNSSVLSGDVVTAVSALKQSVDGDIIVYASQPLVHTLIEHDLVDELRLIVFPFLLGQGARIFGPTSATKPMSLVDAQTAGDSLALLTYRPVRAAD